MPQRFGAQDPPQPPPQPQSEQDDAGQYYDEMSRIMASRGPATEAYKKYLGETPTPEANAPSWLTRIAAGLSGASAGFRNPGEGIKVAQGLNSSRYLNALNAYDERGKGLAGRAQLEQADVNSRLKALQEARAMGLKYNEFELKRLQADNDLQTKTTTANAAMLRAQAYAKAQAKPGYEAVPQQDGSVLYVNKADPQDRQVVPANTIAAGQLGVARGQLGVAQTNARTNQKNAETSVRRTDIYGRSVDENARHNGEMEKRPTSASRPLAPKVQQDAIDNALREMSADPDFGRYITPPDEDGFRNPVVDDGSDGYAAFEEELNDRVDRILKGGAQRPVRPRGGGQ